MTGTDPDQIGVEPTLEPRFARLLALRAAWRVLAPSALSGRGLTISESGRNVTERIKELKETGRESSAQDLKDLDHRLNQFESSMREIAAKTSVAQLRSSLPTFLTSDRPGLLDLLDVLIGNDPSEFAKATSRIGAIDYLITVLCTNGESSGGRIRHDPVTLTPRLQALCERAETVSGDRFTDIEAEFFAASTKGSEDLREEIALRTLRSRKAELGPAFFVPRILRAVVTYNAVLLHRVAAEILDSGDWGFVGNAASEAATGDRSPTSVFAGESLRALGRAVRARAKDQNAKPKLGDPISQVAWALDFEYLAPNELKALLGPRLGTADDPLGSAILVGLLCRSLAVLSGELETIGISADDVSDHWTVELASIFQEQINQSISDDAYQIACTLSELKNKFLSAPVSDQFQQQKELATASAGANSARTETRSSFVPKKNEPTARDLVMDALETSQDERAASLRPSGSSPIYWLRVAQIAIAVGLLVVAGSLFFRSEHDLEKWSSDQLESVSPYLARGGRNQAGVGPAFVGRVDPDWLALPSVQRHEAADQLVRRLRDLGLSQIMIYDRNNQLRIQALGAQSTRVL